MQPGPRGIKQLCNESTQHGFSEGLKNTVKPLKGSQTNKLSEIARAAYQLNTCAYEVSA